MTNKKITVRVTERNAIYVNRIRITNRSTKWGLRQTLDEFEVDSFDEVVPELRKRGWDFQCKFIDDPKFKQGA